MSGNQDDDIDGLLALPRESTENAKRKQATLALTTGVLRRRGRLKKLAWVGGLAACYLAGMATMHWATPAPERQVVVIPPQGKQEEAAAPQPL